MVGARPQSRASSARRRRATASAPGPATLMRPDGLRTNGDASCGSTRTGRATTTLGLLSRQGVRNGRHPPAPSVGHSEYCRGPNLSARVPTGAPFAMLAHVATGAQMVTIGERHGTSKTRMDAAARLGRYAIGPSLYEGA